MTFSGLSVVVLAIMLICGPVRAQDIVMADYDRLSEELDARIAFETLPQRPEPGLNFDAPIREGRARLAERFAGQTLAGTGAFDTLDARTPAAPLRLVAGDPGRNLAIAFHRGFGSNALFPLGSAGFPALEARGEGAVAILFDQSQRAVGLRVHSDYASPLGAGPSRGRITVLFFARDGRLLARHVHELATGAAGFGYRRVGDLPEIAGVMILNDDPGGIAIDDILYQTAPLSG